MSDDPKLGRNRGNAGKGRPKGASNKLTRTVKEAIEAAFSKVGGADYLARMAEEQPVAFMSLLGKILPTQIDANLTGAVGLLPMSLDAVKLNDDG
jgi:hypothetical protein